MLRTILAATLLASYSLVIGLPLLLLAWISGAIGPLYPAAVVGVRAALAVAGVRLRLEGAERIPDGACLFFANHTSAVDPLAVFVSIPRPIAFLAKRELFAIPLLGLAMRRAQFISVDRSSREDAAASADRAAAQLRSGVSTVIYPEGTRSPDGRLLPFKRGGFLLAIRAGRPVVPVTIVGAEQLLPKGGRWLRPGEITLHFHSPIDVTGYREEDREQLLQRVRSAISSARPPDKR